MAGWFDSLKATLAAKAAAEKARGAAAAAAFPGSSPLIAEYLYDSPQQPSAAAGLGVTPMNGFVSNVDPMIGFENPGLLTGPPMNLSSLIGAGLGIIQNLTAPQVGAPAVPNIFNFPPGLTPIEQLQATQVQSAAWGKCAAPSSKRRRVKIMGPPGAQILVPYCAPRRMNPLNARALGRAARRLGSFQRIATHIEKTIQRACKTKSRSRRLSVQRCAPRC